MSEQSLVEFLDTVEILSAFTPAERESLSKAVTLHSYDFGDRVFNAGDRGEGLYIVRSGGVRIFTEAHHKEISMGVRKAGDVFAEIAALREHRHESSVRASAKTVIAIVPRAALAEAFKQNVEAQAYLARYAAIRTAGGFITRLFDLRGKVEAGELEELVRSVGTKRVAAGSTILEQGSSADRRLYVVRSGRVRIVRHLDGNDYPLATLAQGEVFGERACLMRQEQVSSAVAEVDTVLLVIPEQTIHLVLERNPRLREVLTERIEFAEQELQRQKKLADRRRRPVLLDLASKPRAGERIVKRFPLVEQAEQMDCGAACLAMICKHTGIPMTLGKLRELANVTQEGATLDSLARVGESLGFTTRGVQCTFASLLGFELPAIAHWEGYHYIVVYGISKDHVWVAEPALGFRKLTLAEFERGWTGTCLLFTPGTAVTETAATRSPWIRFVRYLKPYKGILGHLLLATLVIQVLGMAPPVIMQNIIDRVVVHYNAELLTVLMAGLIVTKLFTQLTVMLRGFLSNFMVRNLDLTLISQFFKHTLSLPLSFFAKRRTGDIFARFNENLTIRSFLTESTLSTILNLLMVFIYFTVLFIYNVKMTALLVMLVVPLVALTFAVTPKIKDYARRSFEASTDAEAVLMETLGGAETIKGMGIERLMRLKWERKYARALDVKYRQQRFHILVGFASQLLNATVTVVILWVGATLVIRQELTIGQLMAFNMLMGMAMAPLMGLVGLWEQLQRVGVAMERLGDVLDIEPEQKPEDLASRVVLPDLKGELRFEDVYFRYGGNETPYVLENVSFSINPGELVAVVGQSGSGKTTLAKMLVGFYPPVEGKILVDGYDLAQVDKEYFRAQVGYVMQSNLLFSGTIAENIASGDENPDRRRIVEVAQLADAHGFVSKLPLGYEQVVGERGMGLSGGQMQRLCIARALYHDPRLLIFDEATSALDAQSEDNILGNMQEILKGRTAVVIAHRLSTIMQADKILVLYDGAVVEEGKHAELVDRKGMYYQLVQKQMSNAS